MSNVCPLPLTSCEWSHPHVLAAPCDVIVVTSWLVSRSNQSGSKILTFDPDLLYLGQSSRILCLDHFSWPGGAFTTGFRLVCLIRWTNRGKSSKGGTSTKKKKDRQTTTSVNLFHKTPSITALYRSMLINIHLAIVSF